MNSMMEGNGQLKKKVSEFYQSSMTEISEVFRKWVELPDNFGKAKRKRLFSPLKNILAVSVAGTCRGWFLP